MEVDDCGDAFHSSSLLHTHRDVDWVCVCVCGKIITMMMEIVVLVRNDTHVHI